MSQRFNDLNNQRYESIIDFMRYAADVGFNNELDNSRVMRALNDRLEEMWSQLNRKGSYYLTTRVQPHPVHVNELVVTIHSDIDENVKNDTILFIRPERDSIAVRRDVIEDSHHITKGDIPYSGVTVNYLEGERLFLEKGRFNEFAIAAFRSTYTAIAACSVGEPCVLKISPLVTGLDVKYMAGNKKLACIRFEYSQ
jgi:hypothetical protein